MPNPLIGKGWSFPMGVDGRGGISMATNTPDLDQSIRLILGTRIGERVMRPDFGCRINDLIFASINSQTIGLAQHYVEEAIGWWEPRVELVEVTIATNQSRPEEGELLITIRYKVRATKDERSLVYPFYLIAQEQP